jgi:hypothetical protein
LPLFGSAVVPPHSSRVISTIRSFDRDD